MRELVARFWRLIALAGGTALAVMHVGVLWRRVVDGTLLTPLVVAQWFLAVALLAIVVALRRRGVSVFRGRAGAAFWIVVALMHGIVALPGGPGFVGVLDAAPVTAAVPVGFGLVAGALVLLVGLEAWRRRPVLLKYGPAHAARSLAFPAGLPSSIAPRAPPA
ncbi:MAG: hypothetical protein ACE5GX_08535 [Thermoanaerobaculia bacterium]